MCDVGAVLDNAVSVHWNLPGELILNALTKKGQKEKEKERDADDVCALTRRRTFSPCARASNRCILQFYMPRGGEGDGVAGCLEEPRTAVENLFASFIVMSTEPCTRFLNRHIALL